LDTIPVRDTFVHLFVIEAPAFVIIMPFIET
jgi:hypothetical protein